MKKMCSQIIDFIQMYKEDLVLNNLRWLICHETQPNYPSRHRITPDGLASR